MSIIFRREEKYRYLFIIALQNNIMVTTFFHRHIFLICVLTVFTIKTKTYNYIFRPDDLGLKSYILRSIDSKKIYICLSIFKCLFFTLCAIHSNTRYNFFQIFFFFCATFGLEIIFFILLFYIYFTVLFRWFS